MWTPEIRGTLPCPRCTGQLVPFHVPEGRASGCNCCGGIWVDDQAFAALRQGMEDEVVGVADVLNSRNTVPDATERATIRCPTCARMLIPTEVSRVRIDFCTAHGTWVDHGEVEAIANATEIASSGSASQRDWEKRLSGDLGVLPEGLVTALGTVIAVGEHSRRVRRRGR